MLLRHSILSFHTFSNLLLGESIKNVISWRILRALGVVVPFLVVLSLTVPVSVLYAFGLVVDFVQMGQCCPYPHFSSAGLLLWGLFSTRAWGMTVNLGGILSSAFSVFTKVGGWVGLYYYRGY